MPEKYRENMRKIRYIWFVIWLFFSFFSAVQVRAVTTNLKVGILSNHPPYYYIDEEGSPQGMLIDMLVNIAENKNLNLEFIRYDSEEKCDSAFRNGSIDMILGGIGEIREEARSLELVSSSLCVLVSDTQAKKIENAEDIKNLHVLTDWEGKRKAAKNLGMNAETLGNQTKIFASKEELFRNFLKNPASLAVCEKECACYNLREAGLLDEYTILYNYVAQVSYGITLHDSDSILYRTLSAGLGSLRATGTYDEIWENWFVDTDTGLRISKKALRWILLIVFLIVGAICGYVILNSWINKRLRKIVAERTSELTVANDNLQMQMKQLKEEGIFRNQMIEHSPVATVLLNAQKKVIFMNQAALKLTGISGKSWFERLVYELPVFQDIIKRVPKKLFQEEEKKYCESIKVDMGEEKKIYRYTGYRLPSVQNEGMYILSVEDITQEEQKKQEELETEKNKTLNTLIAGIAHEVKNPLMSIYNYAKIIPKLMDNEEFRNAFCTTVPEEINRVKCLIDSLIHYARPSQGKPEWVDVGEVLRDCVILTHVMAKKSRIIIQTEEIQDKIMLYAERDKLKQCFMNLILNSIDAVKEKELQEEAACILLSAKKEEHQIVISIYDDGCGMTQEEMDQCCCAFYTTKAAGNGYGMYFVSSFMEENKGRLQIESKKGEYTRITLYFQEEEN